MYGAAEASKQSVGAVDVVTTRRPSSNNICAEFDVKQAALPLVTSFVVYVGLLFVPASWPAWAIWAAKTAVVLPTVVHAATVCLKKSDANSAEQHPFTELADDEQKQECCIKTKAILSNRWGQTATSIAASVLAAGIAGSVVFGVTREVETSIGTGLEVFNWTSGVAGPAVAIARHIPS
jgi:hypothetical protein